MPDPCPLTSAEPELQDLPEVDRIGLAREADIIRLHHAGMGVDKLGARFRLEYAVIRRIVARETERP